MDAFERREYETPGLEPEDVDPDPIAQFGRWFADARAAAVVEPEAMLVATVDAGGRPSCRYVLLRGVDERGFRFFTNYGSAKARDLDANPAVGLTFGWLEIHRSVRVSGRAERLPAAESDAYFASRPRGSRIGAWASPQSEVIPGRELLDAGYAEMEQRFAGVQDVPRPDGWGGYLVRPDAMELWQGRANRLHDRLRYRRVGGDWVIERLAP
ncbi:MAG TPA: pyridoxamine 5'-phosphate oxidase [Solirubrobacteraceae bacterium]|nr:pyridoxamine 5'-phosphate oxidase [Solirubrobacteraceae bacterium]